MHFALGALALGLVSTSALAEDCPAERAVYTMQSEYGEFRGQFIPSTHFASAASNLYFKLTTPQRPYWFRFASSNGYGGIAVIPIADPYAPEAEENGPADLLGEPEDEFGQVAQRELVATLRFLALDAELQETGNPPSGGDAAPPYLMMPEIGSTLWYAPRALTTDDTAERDPMPRGAFKLAECSPEAPGPAWP